MHPSLLQLSLHFNQGMLPSAPIHATCVARPADPYHAPPFQIFGITQTPFHAAPIFHVAPARYHAPDPYQEKVETPLTHM